MPQAELQKGICSFYNPHPIYSVLSYHRLSPSYYAFTSSLSNESIPKTVSATKADSGWQQAMVKEINALHANHAWDLVHLPPDKTVITCQWVYTVKISSNGKIKWLKTRLVAQRYTQIPGLNYRKIVSVVAKIASIRLLNSLATMNY